MSEIIGLIDHFGPGGAQRQFSYLLGGLASLGHSVTAATYYDYDFFGRDLEEAGVHRCRLRKPSRWSPAVLRDLLGLVKSKNNPRIIAFLSTPSIYAELVSAVSRVGRLVVSERSAIQPSDGLVRRLRNQLHRRADFVVTNSARQKVGLEAQAPFLSGRVVCIYNGYPESTFNERTVTFGGRDGILVLGKVNRNKNPHALAQALAIRRRAGRPPVKVRWAGDCGAYGGEQDVVTEVNRILHDGRVASDWEWLGLRADTIALLDSAVALYNGSFNEGLSNAVCEALCRGVPVIASDISDHTSLVGDEAGSIFNPRDPAQLAEIIDSVVMAPVERWQSLSQRGRFRAYEHLRLDGMVKAYEQLLAD